VARNDDTFGLGNRDLHQPVSEVINNHDHSAVIGSGPFVVASEILGKQIELVARKDYNWGPKTLAH